MATLLLPPTLWLLSSALVVNLDRGWIYGLFLWKFLPVLSSNPCQKAVSWRLQKSLFWKLQKFLSVWTWGWTFSLPLVSVFYVELRGWKLYHQRVGPLSRCTGWKSVVIGHTEYAQMLMKANGMMGLWHFSTEITVNVTVPWGKCVWAYNH